MTLSFKVVGFVKNLADMLEDYEIACEHEHSNCVLIAHNKVYQLIYYNITSVCCYDVLLCCSLRLTTIGIHGLTMTSFINW